MGSGSVGSSERSEYGDQPLQHPFIPPPPPRRDSSPHVGLPLPPPQNSYNGNNDNGQVFLFDHERINQLPMSPPQHRMGTLDNKDVDSFRKDRTLTNSSLISQMSSNNHIDSNRKNDSVFGDDDDEHLYADESDFNAIESRRMPPPPLPPPTAPKPPSRTFSKTMRIGRYLVNVRVSEQTSYYCVS